MPDAVIARPRWRDTRLLRALHLRLAVAHPRISQRLDEERLARALEAPHALIRAGGADPFKLAASYAAGLAGARALRRGGGALALATLEVVLRLAGHSLAAPEAEAAAVFAELEEGTIGAGEIEAWARSKAVRL